MEEQFEQQQRSFIHMLTRASIILWYEKEEAQHTCPLVAPKPALSIFFPNVAQGQLHHHHNINTSEERIFSQGY
jgi:hypothetical protein